MDKFESRFNFFQQVEEDEERNNRRRIARILRRKEQEDYQNYIDTHKQGYCSVCFILKNAQGKCDICGR